MKRSQLVQLIREAVSGSTSKTDSVKDFLAAVERTKKQAEIAKGHAVLDRVSPESIANIVKGGKPIYEGTESSEFTLAQLKAHIKSLEPKDTVKISQVQGDNTRATNTNSAQEWIKKFDDLSSGTYTKQAGNSFKIDGKLFKSDKSKPASQALVRSMMKGQK